MRGIQFYHYKSLQGYLHKLAETKLFNVPCDHMEMITQHEEKLKQIYTDYRRAFENISAITKEFDEHKKSIYRLVSLHKHCKKSRASASVDK